MYDKEIKILKGLKCGYLQFRDWEHPLRYDSDGSVYLHRHLASIKLGRWLTTEEHVHHIDENKLNNNADNLLVLSNVEHKALHNKGGLSKNGRLIDEVSCVNCGISFKPLLSSKKLYCSNECYAEDNVVNKDLTKELLDELIPNTSWVALGRMFGYSDNGIRKRAKALGCDIIGLKRKAK